MKACYRTILVSVLAVLIAVPGRSQFVPGAPNSDNRMYDLHHTNWLVVGTVKTAQGDSVRGIPVMVSPLHAAGSRVVFTDAQGAFSTEYDLNVQTVNDFAFVLTVKKKGYQTAHAYADFLTSGKSWQIPLTLRGLEEDGAQLSLADLISGLAPRLKQLGPAQGLAANSEKDYGRAVADFLEQNNPERAVILLSKVAANNPSCIGCRTFLGLAQMSWGDWDGANRTLRESVNATLRDPQKGRPECMVAYGTWLNWQHQPDRAEPFFAEALKFAPKDALALQERGRALQLLQRPQLANNALRDALAAGAGPEARLLYIQSCIDIGHFDEGNAEMKQYLNGRDAKDMPVRVRQLWASLQDREKIQATYAKDKTPKGQEHVDFLRRPPADLLHNLEPAKDQDALNPVLDRTGAKILELIADFPNTSSLEAIHQEKLGRKGKVRESQDQKFRYLCLVPHEAWGPSFLEYRADFAGNEVTPRGLAEGFMLTEGFTSAELFFHPAYRTESTFCLLGRQRVNGRNTFVVAFAQIPQKAHLYGNFKRGQTTVPTFSQGLAWIDADNYRIIRMRTDLLAPLPELQLEKETLDIDFNEVHFSHRKEALWLPENVTVNLDWNGKLLRNRHEYSEFKIFDVEASEKIGKPKVPAETFEEPHNAFAPQ